MITAALAIVRALLPSSTTLAIWGVVAVLGGTGVTAWSVHEQNVGYARAIAHVAAQNKEAVDAVNTARDRVRACNADNGMRWDQSASECVRRD